MNMNATIQNLTSDEQARLAECENEIHTIIGWTIEVQNRQFESVRRIGALLKEIRDRKLWRDKAPTFADYCTEQFDFSDKRASQIIVAHETGKDMELRLVIAVKNMAAVERAEIEGEFGAAGIPLPDNERELRALRTVPQGLRVRVWLASLRVAKQAGIKASGVSGKLITQVASNLKAVSAKPAIAPKTNPARAAQILAAADQKKRLDAVLAQLAFLDSASLRIVIDAAVKLEGTKK